MLCHEAGRHLRQGRCLALELNRSIGPERRLVQAMELSDLLRQLAASGLKARHPDYSEEQLRRALNRQFYGDDAGRAVPDLKILPASFPLRA